MVLQIDNQPFPAVDRGGMHHVSDVVALVLAGLKKSEGPLHSQTSARCVNQGFGITTAQATSALA